MKNKKDHCTGAPDGLFGYNWGDQCEIHDVDYWYQKEDRKVADARLRDGMMKKLPTYLHWIAWIYYFVVRGLGWIFWIDLNFMEVKMAKIKIIENGKLDKIGLKKIGKSLLLTVGASILGWIGNSVGVIDYGSAETIIATVLPFIVNAGYKWLGKYESKN